MITTIQINNNVKDILNKMKETGKESYEDIIIKMIHIVEAQKRKQKELLIEGCKEMVEESLKITKEFETIENLENWEWKDD